MPVDPSIPLQIQQPNILGILSNVSQLKAMQQQNELRKLQMEQAKMESEEQHRQMGRQNALRELATRSIRPGGSVTTNTGAINVGGMELAGRDVTAQGPAAFDRNAFVNNLTQSDPMAAMDVQSKFAQQDMQQQQEMVKLQTAIAELAKTKGEAGKLQLAQIKEQMGIVGQYANAVLSAPPEMRPQIAAQVAAQAVQSGMVQPEQLPAGILEGQYTPEAEQWLMAKRTEALEVDKSIDNALASAQAEEAARHNKKTESQASAVLGETARHNKATEALTKSGQDKQLEAAKNRTSTLKPKDVQAVQMKLNNINLARQQLQNVKKSFDSVKGTAAAGPWYGGNINFVGPGRAQLKAAIDGMRNTVTTLTRTPGIGSMSDFETRLMQAQLPEGGNEREVVTAQKIQQIDEMLQALEGGYQNMIAGEGGAPQQQGGGEVTNWTFDANGNLVRQ
jgi:hypothetical protein